MKKLIVAIATLIMTISAFSQDVFITDCGLVKKSKIVRHNYDNALIKMNLNKLIIKLEEAENFMIGDYEVPPFSNFLGDYKIKIDETKKNIKEIDELNTLANIAAESSQYFCMATTYMLERFSAIGSTKRDALVNLISNIKE